MKNKPSLKKLYESLSAIERNGALYDIGSLDKAKLKLIASVHKDQAVILRGDEQSYHKDNVKVLNVCQKAGIWNISFATRDPEETDKQHPAPKAAP